MGRLAAGTVIARAILAMNGTLVRDVQADQGQRLVRLAALSSTTPVPSGPRSERVLSLLLTLEALRAAPEVLVIDRR